MSEVAERERVAALMQAPNAIFCFGSNLAGRHGRGAALTALVHYGALRGNGVGPVGRSYAIPTKDATFSVLSIAEIAEHVRLFLAYATEHPEKLFVVTRVGFLAGFLDGQIAPLFVGSPENVALPLGWAELIA